MAIKRVIYVTQKRLDVCIDVTYGSDLLPIQLTVADYAIPIGAIAVAYVNSESDETKKVLCEINDNVISFTPDKALFEVGDNVLQLRVVYEEKSLFSYKCSVKCHESFSDDDAKEVESQPTLVEQLLTDVANVNLRSESLENDITELESSMNSVNKDTSELKSNLNTANKNIDSANKNIDNLSKDITDTKKGESTPEFTSYDNAEEVKEVLEVDSIAEGDKLNIILSKLTKFTNNIRWLFNFLKPTEVQDNGYESLPDVVSDVKDLNDRDYELGTDSGTGWTYRKWNNGFVELWRMCNPAYSNGNVLNSYYEFPFTLTRTLTANGTLNATNNSQSQLHGNVKVIIQKAGATVSVHDALGGYAESTVKDVSVAVTGWWK